MFQCASRRFMMKRFASSINNKISLSKLSLLKVKTMAVSRSFNTRLLYNSLSCKILRDTVMNSKSILSSLKFSSFSTSLIVPCQNYCLNKRCYSTTHKKITKNVKMEAILKDFEKLNKNDSIDEVSKILEELINITLTPEEYNTYLSFFEEITYFAKERIHQISNQNQILTFIQFFILKDESDIPLWDEINAAALKILPELDIDAILDITELLKGSNKLNDKLGFGISRELKFRLNTIDINNIPYCVLVISSFEEGDDDFSKQVDKAIMKNIDADINSKEAYERISGITNESFSVLCHVSHKHNHYFKNFMVAGKQFIKEKIETFTMLELSQIILAYSIFENDFSAFQNAEQMILDNSSNITIFELVNFMQAYLVIGGSDDLWDKFDMIIGKNIGNIIPEQVVPLLKCLCNSPKKREKLFILFQSVIKNLNFSLADDCMIIRIYGEINFNQEFIYDLISQRISDKVTQMTDDDIVNANIGYLSAGIEKKYKISNILQQQLAKIVSNISLFNATTLLLKFGTLKKGSKPLVQSLLDRVLQITQTSVEINPLELYMIINAYNLLGACNDYYVAINERLIASVKM